MYQKLEIWQESIKLIKEVYSIVETLPKSEEYNLKSQIKRAVVSVALNIAEGKCRNSAKEFAHFLNISVASLNEVDACVLICQELDYIDNYEELHEKCTILSKRISALKSKLLKGLIK